MDRNIINGLIAYGIFIFGLTIFFSMRKTYVYYSDPHHNKNLLEYSLIHFREKEKEFHELGKYYTEIKTKYPRFFIVKDVKFGLSCEPVGPFEEDSSFIADTTNYNYGLITYTEITAPGEKQLDFKLTRGDEYLMEKLGITQIFSKTDSSGNRYLRIYSEEFNKFANQKEIILYYLPDNASKTDFVSSYSEFTKASDAFDEKEGFFVEDKNWIFVIKHMQH